LKTKSIYYSFTKSVLYPSVRGGASVCCAQGTKNPSYVTASFTDTRMFTFI